MALYVPGQKVVIRTQQSDLYSGDRVVGEVLEVVMCGGSPKWDEVRVHLPSVIGTEHLNEWHNYLGVGYRSFHRMALETCEVRD